jgi:hypothetical protein
MQKDKFLSNFHIELKTSPSKETYKKYKTEIQKTLGQINEIENKKLILEQIDNLNKHHHQTTIHCLMVARDVNYIATKLNLPKNKITKLTLAAYIHDIGKINITNTILNLKGKEELNRIWEYTHKTKAPKTYRKLLKTLTINQVINYKAQKSHDKTKYLKNFNNWWQTKQLPNKYLKLSIHEYLKLHQHFTEEILTSCRFDNEIIQYASSHHSWYFTYLKQKKIPKESKIIEIADRFNAIAQTEGKRTYTKKRTKIEALITIINEMLYIYKIKRDFILKTKTFEKEIIYTLIIKYFPEEITGCLRPKIQSLINEYEATRHKITKQACNKLITDIHNMINIIQSILKIDKTFKRIKFNGYAKYKRYIQNIIYLQNSSDKLLEILYESKKKDNDKKPFSKSSFLKNL